MWSSSNNSAKILWQNCRIENNDDPEVVQLILSQTGFFFGGGDQERIITSLVSFNCFSLNFIQIKQFDDELFSPFIVKFHIHVQQYPTVFIVCVIYQHILQWAWPGGVTRDGSHQIGVRGGWSGGGYQRWGRMYEYQRHDHIRPQVTFCNNRDL